MVEGEEMREIRGGDRVRFIGCSDEQVQWGGSDDPRKVLELGSEYDVYKVEEYSWHTKITLVCIRGRFPSVCFEVVE